MGKQCKSTHSDSKSGTEREESRAEKLRNPSETRTFVVHQNRQKNLEWPAAAKGRALTIQTGQEWEKTTGLVKTLLCYMGRDLSRLRQTFKSESMLLGSLV